MISYKGFEGVCTHAPRLETYCGTAMRGDITVVFQAKTRAQLQKAMEQAVDQYFCYFSRFSRLPSTQSI